MQTEEIMPRTLAQKIWHDHHVTTRNDGRQLIYMDRHVIHELHGPHAFERVAMEGGVGRS